MTTGEETKVDSDQAMPEVGVASDSNGAHRGNSMVDVKSEEPSNANKRTRTNSQDIEGADSSVKRVKGVAPIKAESATPLS
jgi:tRNA-dihydrouridine synthase 3